MRKQELVDAVWRASNVTIFLSVPPTDQGSSEQRAHAKPTRVIIKPLLVQFRTHQTLPEISEKLDLLCTTNQPTETPPKLVRTERTATSATGSRGKRDVLGGCLAVAQFFRQAR